MKKEKKKKQSMTSLRSRRERSVARTRAEQATKYVESLKAASGGAWSAAELVEFANLTPLTLKEWRDNFSIVYWTDDKGSCFYPKWQFDDRLQVLPVIRTILGLLSTHDTTHVLNKFLAPAVGDMDESVLDLIQSGRNAAALAFVGSFIEGDAAGNSPQMAPVSIPPRMALPKKAAQYP